MSGILTAIGSLGPGASALGGIENAALQMIGLIPSRSIGGILPDCVVQEQHRSDMQITEHPTEAGASITDHAFVRPVELTIHALWSNSSQVSNMAAGLLSGTLPSIGGILGMFTEGYAASMWQKLLDLQASRKVMTVVTGKKRYPNMLISSLMLTNTALNEFGLDAVITCKQVIIVSNATALLPAASQASPQVTAGVSDLGTVQPQPVTAPPGLTGPGGMLGGGV